MIGKKAKNKPSFIGIECIPQAIKVGWSMIDISIKVDQIILIKINYQIVKLLIIKMQIM